MDDLAAKSALRTHWRSWRAALPQAARAERIARAVNHLQRSAAWRDAGTVAVYLALPSEPDLAPLITEAWNTGRTVAIPRVDRRAAPLVWHRHTPDRRLHRGRFGVREPGRDAPIVAADALDLIVVPALAVDQRGHRLGYGGGYYDRTLLLSPRAHRVWLGLAEQVVPRVPAGPHDIPVHAAITDEGPHPRMPRT